MPVYGYGPQPVVRQAQYRERRQPWDAFKTLDPAKGDAAVRCVALMACSKLALPSATGNVLAVLPGGRGRSAAPVGREVKLD